MGWHVFSVPACCISNRFFLLFVHTVQKGFVVFGIISVIIFVVTEDMTNTMAYTDRWTIFMAILLAADAVILALSKRKDKEVDSEEVSEE